MAVNITVHLVMVSIIVFIIADARNVCFYTNWSKHRSGKAQFLPANIDMRRCTHVVHAYAKPEGLMVVTTDPNDDATPSKEGLFARVNKMRFKNPKVKYMLSIGGKKVGPGPFASIVKSKESMETFSKNVMSFLRQRQLDGLDMAWEYPDKKDKSNFLSLMEQIMKVFENEGDRNDRERLLLSVTVPGLKSKIDAGYDVEQLSKTVDFMNIKSFDFEGDSDSGVIFHSPLYARPDQNEPESEMNVDWVAKYYVSLGVPKDKLNLGIPTHSRSYTLKDAKKSSLTAKFTGKGKAGPFTQEAGLMAFYEVCDMFKEGEVVAIHSQRSFYAVRDNLWVSFEGIDGAKAKACYATLKGYGGLFIWSLDLDDFADFKCNLGVDPILRAATDAFTNPSVCGDVVEITRPITPRPPTTKLTTTTTTTTQLVTTKEPPLPDLYRTVCYYTNWAQFRNGDGKFLPEHIDPSLCSHIMYGFAKPERLNLVPIEDNDESTETEEGMYSKVIRMKRKNINLKVLLSVGGSYLGPKPFRHVVESQETMTQFATNVVAFLRKRGFDGLDLDWQYPSDILKTAADKPKFQRLVETLMREFKRDEKTGKDRLLLTVAASPEKDFIDKSYFISNLSRTVDFISLMTFDLHGAWEDTVGFNSPLYAHPDEKEPASQLNVDWVAKYYQSQGAPKNILNIGIATYGRTFTLKDPSQHAVLSPATGKGTTGLITQEEGVMAYYEVCLMFAKKGKLVRETSQKNPYYVKDDQWVGFDDVESVKAKADYVIDHDFGGVVIWPLDFDDFLGNACNQGKYPLLTTAHTKMKEASDEQRELEKKKRYGKRASTSHGCKLIGNKGFMALLVLLVTLLNA